MCVCVHAVNQEGHTPLHNAWCVWKKSISSRSFLDNGADVNALDATNASPLHLAAFQGHVDVVKLLVQNGAKVNAEMRNRISGHFTLPVKQDM